LTCGIVSPIRLGRLEVHDKLELGGLFNNHGRSL
jgi:hypothetical protein